MSWNFSDSKPHHTTRHIYIFQRETILKDWDWKCFDTKNKREWRLVYKPTYLSALKSEIMGREKVFGFWTRAYNHNRLEYFLCNHHLLRVCIHLGLKWFKCCCLCGSIDTGQLKTRLKSKMLWIIYRLITLCPAGGWQDRSVSRSVVWLAGWLVGSFVVRLVCLIIVTA